MLARSAIALAPDMDLGDRVEELMRRSAVEASSEDPVGAAHGVNHRKRSAARSRLYRARKRQRAAPDDASAGACDEVEDDETRDALPPGEMLRKDYLMLEERVQLVHDELKRMLEHFIQSEARILVPVSEVARLLEDMVRVSKALVSIPSSSSSSSR